MILHSQLSRAALFRGTIGCSRIPSFFHHEPKKRRMRTAAVKSLRRYGSAHGLLKKNHLRGRASGIACGYASLRCAAEMLCSRCSLLRSNPVLRRGSHPASPLKGWRCGGTVSEFSQKTTFVVGLAGLLTAMPICAARVECFARDACSCVRTRCFAGFSSR